MARQGSDPTEGPYQVQRTPNIPISASREDMCAHLGLGKEPDSPNQYVLVSPERSLRIKCLNSAIRISFLNSTEDKRKDFL